jgi:hypothetical protein
MIKLKSLIREWWIFQAWWMHSDGSIEKVDNHLEWISDNLPLDDYYKDDDLLVNKKTGSIADEESIYQEAYKRGMIRMVKAEGGSEPVYIGYSKSVGVSPKQMKALKDFCIENGYPLRDGVTGRDVLVEY